ncbi:MAG: polysaccharide deacetylase family protein [Wenzhouxiangellaceae bacterium]|nr:polysaccharide deacetylase family protein [Wenzhouxiangellaceae bacterium]
MEIPVLCYHAHILPSSDYADNGHRALASDLELIQASGRRIVPLDRVVDWVAGERGDEEMAGAVALSFDDGTRLDFEATDHPELGPLPGFLPLLEEFAARCPATQPTVHATCFVIASPRAREQADCELLFGLDWLDSGWWRAAENSGRIAIENHSWDHNMAVAEEAPLAERDRFDNVETFEHAEHEIARAQEFLAAELGRRPRLFGYPYGQSNEYLTAEYLPKRGAELGLRAAFSTAGRAVRRDDSCWNLPRYVHGHHWRDPAGLAEILEVHGARA